MRGLLPGERGTIELTHVTGSGRVFAVASHVDVASPDRMDVACPRFLSCGGCDLLHLSRPAELAAKRRFVAEALGLPIDRVEATLHAGSALGYRALAKLVVGPGRILGSYRPHSHDVEDMQGCLVHAPVVERVADRLRGILADLPEEPTDLRYVLIRGSLREDRAIVTLVAREPQAKATRAIAAKLEEAPQVARLVLKLNVSAGDELLGPGPEELLLDRGAPDEAVGDIVLSLEAGAFAQINPKAAALLYRTLADALDPRGKRVIDLYSGSGGIALTLLVRGAAFVEAVERDHGAVKAAARSAERQGVADKVTFTSAPVEAALPGLAPADQLVLNPPRKGAPPAVLEAICRRAPLRLAYVSCEPATLARDLASLRRRVPMKLLRVVPVDLFPRTKHVETLVVADLG